ncbi:MAG: hypothetical protein IPG60_07355 [Bacteroidetes bacterium]|nr:hypothetical protein [Bacteroidota bacterium]
MARTICQAVSIIKRSLFKCRISHNTYGLHRCNYADESIDNSKIRQAINYAINRKEIILFLRNGRGIPAEDGIVPPSLYHQYFYEHFGYNYNPSKAIQLFKEAGFENGIGLPEIMLHTTDQYRILLFL